MHHRRPYRGGCPVHQITAFTADFGIQQNIPIANYLPTGQITAFAADFGIQGRDMGNCAELPFPATRMVHRRRPYRRRNHTRHTYRRFCAPGRPEACEVGRRGDRRPRAGYEGGFAMWSPTGVTQKTAVVKPVYVTFSRGPGPPSATTTTAGPSRASHPPHTTGGGGRVTSQALRSSTV